MTERERIIEEIAHAIQDAMEDSDFHTPMSLARVMSEAALEIIEQKLPTDVAEIIPCTCGHNGYGKHMVGCPLYGN